MWTNLLTALKNILEANTNIQETWDYEPDNFDGDPACIITPSNNENDFNTNEENMRIYAFSVKLFVSRTGTNNNNTADDNLRQLVDSVLDDFDKNWNLNTVSNPTGYTFINLFAVPSVWGYSGRDDEYRVAEIVVRCRVAVDVNAIS